MSNKLTMAQKHARMVRHARIEKLNPETFINSRFGTDASRKNNENHDYYMRILSSALRDGYRKEQQMQIEIDELKKIEL